MTESHELELRRSLRALRQDRDPVRDLWPGIESRLAPSAVESAAPSRRVQWPRWAALAAGVVLALGVVLAPRLDRMAANDTGTRNVLALRVDDEKADPALVLLDAYTEVLAAEHADERQWTRQMGLPGGADRIAAVRELDASLVELAAALRLAPESQLLRRLMHQTLQQRAGLALTALGA